MPPYMQRKTVREWVDALAREGVPCGPVNSIDQVFADPQVVSRGMRIDVAHAAARAGTVPLIASPLRMSTTPPDYWRGPPLLGQHTDEVLEELLGLGADERSELRRNGVIA
jgi:crotonobetainyl-CoA:carnitine CoA-transferase CaiB-like acyl-CoA transferase